MSLVHHTAECAACVELCWHMKSHYRLIVYVLRAVWMRAKTLCLRIMHMIHRWKELINTNKMALSIKPMADSVESCAASKMTKFHFQNPSRLFQTVIIFPKNFCRKLSAMFSYVGGTSRISLIMELWGTKPKISNSAALVESTKRACYTSCWKSFSLWYSYRVLRKLNPLRQNSDRWGQL